MWPCRAGDRPPAALTPAEIARRRPVWGAFSDLFLDTETRWGLTHIALTALASEYTVAELESIFFDEITPECAWNLAQIAGEWAVMPLDESALARRAVHLPQGRLARAMNRVRGSMLREQWEAVMALWAQLALDPPPVRAVRARVFDAFAHAYLEPTLATVLALERHVDVLRESARSRAELTELFESDFRPVYRRVLVGDEIRDEPARAANVHALIARAG